MALEVLDRMAKRLPLVRVSERAVEARLGDSHRSAGDVDAAEFERRERLLEALPFDASKQILRRHAALVQEHLARFRAFVAELAEISADNQSRCLALDQKHRHAPVARLSGGVGFDQDRQRIGVSSIGDPGLGAADDVVVAITSGGRDDALKVAAG
jgi:hypothetical protein